MHRNTASGYETDYGSNEDLSYTFNNVNQMSAISDADDANFSCTVTCDANNNITEIEEVQTSGADTATLTTNFSFDWGNRLTQHKTQQFNNSQNDLWVTERDHTVDAIGRTAKSGFKEYWGDAVPPSPDTLEHVYDRSKMLQNYDGTSSYGEVWHWAGAQNAHAAPLKSPNADTASQKGYNISNDKTPQRRTFTNPTSEGDQRNLYGQGKPMAKNSSGSGADWYLGTEAESSSIVVVKVNSRTMYDGTVTATDMDRATDAREKGRIGIFGTGNAYAGSSGRVTSERIGRDLNPLGRGDGNAYVGGAQNYGRIAPSLPQSMASPGGWGNSVNNGCTGCSGFGDYTPLGIPGEVLPPNDPPPGIPPSPTPPTPEPPHVPGKPPPSIWFPERPWPPQRPTPPGYGDPVPPGTGIIREKVHGWDIEYYSRCKSRRGDHGLRRHCAMSCPKKGMVRNPCCGKVSKSNICDAIPCLWPEKVKDRWCVVGGGPGGGTTGTTGRDDECESATNHYKMMRRTGCGIGILIDAGWENFGPSGFNESECHNNAADNAKMIDACYDGCNKTAIKDKKPVGWLVTCTGCCNSQQHAYAQMMVNCC